MRKNSELKSILDKIFSEYFNKDELYEIIDACENAIIDLEEQEED